MNINIEDIGPCQKILHVDIPTDRVEAVLRAAAAALAGRVAVPGFRRGRAPVDVVRKRFARDVEDEAKEQLIHEGLRAVLEQHPMRIVSEVHVEKFDFQAGRPMAFKAHVEVVPDFTLPEYRGLPLARRKQEVKEDAVTEMFNLLRDRVATWADAAGRAARMGDLVVVDYEGTMDGKPIVEAAPKAGLFGRAQDLSVLADEKTILPGLGTSLVDMTVGERKQVDVDFPADFFDPQLAGRKAAYFVTVKGIQEKRLPELDAEFFKLFQVESEEQFRDRIRKDLAAAQEAQEDQRLRGLLIDQLLEKTAMDLPPTAVARETERVVYDMVSNLRARSVEKDEIEKHKEQLFQSAQLQAQRRVKLRYILDRIAEAEHIEAAGDEVDRRIDALADRHRTTPRALREELEKRDALDGVKMDVEIDKTLAWLLAQAAVTVSEAPADKEKTS